ncbi:DNA-directed RNA polymerase subunit beta' [Fontisphaera persica]|uniref:DNA-directed RNA polymerase subunit beta' n=1 Tax=Fontisphaera persica TaxID=2974023 RepID=UPI0024C063C4|nr:DNA-directed RNA polymerase subunit beta' [Fontisphaera persica]WCJ59557.1 DNA-directed RNA polymerase subunit beta' [Fontisphaera persica]
MNTKETARELLGLDKVNQVDYVAISIASPEAIRSWSKGEVKNPETINYRTFKPERGGLFCERIFGPVKDWECSCGKYKRIKHRGVVCDRCGVEVTLARVRRERMGHIELAVPVSHIWFFKCMPSRIGLVLDMTARDLERVIYYEDYMVIDPGQTPLQLHQLLSEHEYREARETYGPDAFVAKMGAEAVREALANVNLPRQIDKLQQQMQETKSKQIRKKLAKRIRLLGAFVENRVKPEWMILTVLPVIPPDLRPLVPLEGGRFATSDLNDLYRRVINRNNRLKNLLQLKTPEVIIRNEKRMLQEAVDALFDNGRHGRAVTGAGNRPLKSLSDMLKGKSGRFRQNLLGKRVDYSGRSVIVIGPELKLHQCGLPKKMALVLFEPFIIRRLKELGFVHTVRSAKKMIERQATEVWDILEEVTKGHPVLLNRAPTLHRLSIQAFEPMLIEGEAIRIHPLVCTAYNADFDGDQMAVHVPLSIEAQMEARLLMMAPNNIFSPSSGRPIMTPTQDITLGCFYLTAEPRQPKDPNKRLMLFGSKEEVIFAYREGELKTHSRVRLANPDYGRQTVYGDPRSKVIETTVGRVIFSEVWPERLGFFNKVAGKNELGDLIWNCYKHCGHDETIATLDRLKELGFREATRAGVSIGIEDMIIPEEKEKQIREAQKQIAEVEKQYRKGVITDGERYNKIVDIWTHCTDQISTVMLQTLERNRNKSEYNPIFLMVNSGARGNKQQVRQLAGLRGLMAKPSGDIIEKPILSNFREGLTVLEYFISTHGARKGLADTALKTADSGYMTRKLVDVAQDVIVREEDCGTVNGIWVQAIMEGEDEIVKLRDRLVGRCACDDIYDPLDPKRVLVQANEEIDEEKARAIENANIERVKIRSVLTCESKHGVCIRCYGRNLATGQMVKLGEAVGIIAAQSIGEPGTQLTMRTFHIGGTASQVFKQPQIKAKHDGIIKYHELRCVPLQDGNHIVLNKNGSIVVLGEDGRELESHTLVIGSVISIPDGGRVKKGEAFVQWDPYNVPIISEKSGRIRFHDIIEGVTMKQEEDEATGQQAKVVIDHKEDLHPQIIILDEETNEMIASYPIPSGAHIVVDEDDIIEAGALLAKTPRKVSKTKDITGGLPRVAELFEARRPKDAAEISKIDGVVDFGPTVRGKRCIIIKDPQTGQEEEHLIPIGKHVIVFKGDVVKRGQQLTEGPIDPHEILEICGSQQLQEHLVNEVQEVYRLQGVTINDKHIEIIVRQMLRKVRITEPGDTRFLWGEQVDKLEFEEENQRVEKLGGKPAECQPVLLGITKASLETESFLSAASFQDTTRVLTEAATTSRVDYLRGFKENVIMGHIIPAGTGYPAHRNVQLKPLVELEETAPEAAPAAAAAGEGEGVETAPEGGATGE